MPRPLVPDEDLYARLEVAVDASPEAIELAWRALLKRHHPDVAGEDAASLERAKRINVAHDWLGDPVLRERYDRERPGEHRRAHRRPAWASSASGRLAAPPRRAASGRAGPARRAVARRAIAP